jgi:hypothetical protein
MNTQKLCVSNFIGVQMGHEYNVQGCSAIGQRSGSIYYKKEDRQLRTKCRY